VVHSWQLQAQSGQMFVAVLLADFVVNQNEVFSYIVIAVDESVSAVLFFNGVAKHLNVAGSLV
jgi:hypothetical protein